MSNEWDELEIVFSQEAQAQEATALAARYGLSSRYAAQRLAGPRLHFFESRLELVDPSVSEKGLSLNFSALWSQWQRTAALSKQSLLARACGLNKRDGFLIWDLTLGLARDALVLVGLGARVMGVERSKLVFCLVDEALQRVSEEGRLHQVLPRLQCVHGNGMEWLRGDRAAKETPPDVIYLDPMYPEKRKRALPGKEMQILQKIQQLSTDAHFEAREWVEAALPVARSRVVLKRPPQAEKIGRPDHSYLSKSVRFDMYLTFGES